MSQRNQYVGLDVSLKETSICVIDEADKIVWRGRVDSTPKAIASAVKQHSPHAVRIGLESGQLSNWLFQELQAAGLPVICVDARRICTRLDVTPTLRHASPLPGHTLTASSTTAR